MLMFIAITGTVWSKANVSVGEHHKRKAVVPTVLTRKALSRLFGLYRQENSINLLIGAKPIIDRTFRVGNILSAYGSCSILSETV